MKLQTAKNATGQQVLWAAINRLSTENHMLRLDAGAYCNASCRWTATLTDGVKNCRLDSLANVHQPIMFGKREMVGSETKGIPVYSSSEMLMLQPEPAFYLSRRFEQKVNNLLEVKKGWVLVSRTGSIGYTLYITEKQDGWIVDDHMIRIIPNNARLGALLYTYLSSPPGQAALHALAYGAVQLVIKDIQVAAVQIPQLTDSAIDGIAHRIKVASLNRTKADELFHSVNIEVHDRIGLPVLKKSYSLGPRTACDVESFSVTARQIGEVTSSACEWRLDAHFFNPSAQFAIANIRKCQCEIKTVAEVARQVVLGPRFKRNYVESIHGVPFLSGKNIVQIRPELKYLSNLQMAEMQELVVKQGWTLITCSGTIGRTCFVWKNFEDYAASQHILRVIPDESKIDPGYLYAFLSSRYGYEQILRYRHGSVIDEITDKQIEHVLIPCPSPKEQRAIGDKVREAYEKRAEAIRLEDEAQAILMKELTMGPGTKGV